MGTKPYVPRTEEGKRVQSGKSAFQTPAGEFAAVIGKPTQEWEARDIRKYIRWLWKTLPYASGRYKGKDEYPSSRKRK